TFDNAVLRQRHARRRWHGGVHERPRKLRGDNGERSISEVSSQLPRERFAGLRRGCGLARAGFTGALRWVLSRGRKNSRNTLRWPVPDLVSGRSVRIMLCKVSINRSPRNDCRWRGG